MNICKRLAALLLSLTVLLTLAMPYATADYFEADSQDSIESGSLELTDTDEAPPTDSSEPEESASLCQHGLDAASCIVCHINSLIASLPDTVDLDNLAQVTDTLDSIADAWPELGDLAVLVLGLEHYAAATESARALQNMASAAELAAASPAAASADSYAYIKGNGETAYVTDYTIIDSAFTGNTLGSWGGNAWFVVTEDVELEGDTSILGQVNIILTDGHTLKLSTSSYGTALSIYGQSEGTGTLSVNKLSVNNLLISHCRVIAITDDEAALQAGDIDIYNSTVYASASKYGINSSSYLDIENSTVEAYGGAGGGGIWGNGAMNIVNSTVTASGDSGIWSGSSIAVISSTVSATATGSSGDSGAFRASTSLTLTDSMVTASGNNGSHGLANLWAPTINGGVTYISGGVYGIISYTDPETIVFVDEVFWGKDSNWVGHIYVGDPVVVNPGETLHIPDGLVLERDVVNNGTIYVDGEITGQVTGNAPYYGLTTIDCTASGELSTYNGKQYAQAGTAIALSTDKTTYNWSSTPNVEIANNSFTMPSYALTVTATAASDTVTSFSYSVTVSDTVVLHELNNGLYGQLSVTVTPQSAPQAAVSVLVDVSSDNDYKLLTSDLSEYSIDYGLTPIEVFTFTDMESQTQLLNITADKPEYAGTYSDTVRFIFRLSA